MGCSGKVHTDGLSPPPQRCCTAASPPPPSWAPARLLLSQSPARSALGEGSTMCCSQAPRAGQRHPVVAVTGPLYGRPARPMGLPCPGEWVSPGVPGSSGRRAGVHSSHPGWAAPGTGAHWWQGDLELGSAQSHMANPKCGHTEDPSP